MLCRKTNAANVRSSFASFSLSEVLLSLTLSTFLLFCLGTTYAAFSQEQAKQKELLMLQKEGQQIMNYFQHHIQHLGYQGANRNGSNFSLFEKNKKHYALKQTYCFIFFYDLNNDGCLGRRPTKNSACAVNNLNTAKELAKEVFGFKLENQEIYIYDKNTLENCIGSQCQRLLEACGEKWKKLTSVVEFKVDKLSFSWLKEDEVLKIDLRLSSVKEKTVNYTIISYVYILNSADYVSVKE